MTSLTFHGVVINRAKFDACTSSNSEELKQTDRHRDTQTDRIALYMLDNCLYHFIIVPQKKTTELFVAALPSARHGTSRKNYPHHTLKDCPQTLTTVYKFPAPHCIKMF